MSERIICKSLSLSLLFLFLLSSIGCYPPAYRRIIVPLRTIHYSDAAGPHNQLFVYLPGNGDDPSAFKRHSMLDEMRARGISADVVAVDAYLAYYDKGIIISRLKQDVIDPAKAAGYRDIWLVGNSLGGYGSLLYVRQYPQDITGVILLGPYLGEQRIVKSILQAGGLAKWDPGTIGNTSREGWDKHLWLWLRNYSQHERELSNSGKNEKRENHLPIIYLGFGKFDRFADAQKLLAEELPPLRVVIVSGGHDWLTWRELWGLLLNRTARDQFPVHEITP